ncbi:MAG TPA: hypothetical protein VHX65_03170 [Pirellulales bacterium]|jgi:type IV secretory pathway TrbD component|nr:hypothetical protein [Pirellulales bacterium]
MDTLRKQVARARRRLILGQFFAALAWSLSAALAVAAIGLAARKLFPLHLDGRIWATAWIGSALLVGFVAAAVCTWLARRDPLFAAIEIDRRFALKERVSSVLSLSPRELETEAGQALVSDALRRLERVDIASRFAVPLGKRSLLPLVPAVVVFGLTFLSDKVRPTEAAATVSPQTVAQIHQSAEVLRRKLEQQRQEAAEKGLADAGDLFKKVEQGVRELAKKQSVDRKQALVDLNDLAKQLEARKKELGGDEKLKQELGQMKDMQSGPAEKLADAMKNGRFERALKELEKLQDALKADKLDPNEQQRMAQQLEHMKQTLDRSTDKHQQVQRELKKQIEQFKNAGQMADAKRLQKQLDQLRQQSPQMNELKQMAGKFGQISKSLQSGKPGEAAQSLNDLAQQVQSLKRQADEQTMLDQSLDQITDCRSSMTGDKDGKNDGGKQPGSGQLANGKNGNGKKGKRAKNGSGRQDGSELSDEMADGDALLEGGQRDGSGNEVDDNGMVAGDAAGNQRGRESGRRSEGANGVKFYDSKVAQKIGHGAAIITGEADGPNSKGNVRAEIQAQLDSAKHDDSDPLTGQRLPRSQRDFAKEYFDSLREGN